MKRLTPYVVIFAVLLIAACNTRKSEPVAQDDTWPEMDAFHFVMAESFHPFKDSANLEPAKAQAAELAASATTWANAPLPEKVNTDEVKADLAQLKTDASAFAELVQEGDSEKIGEALTALHDQFHKLQEAWYGGDKKTGHSHEGGHDHDH